MSRNAKHDRGARFSGALEFRHLLLQRLERALPGFTLAEDGLAPVLGAVLLLAVEFGTGAAPTAAFVENLRCTSAAVTELAG